MKQLILLVLISAALNPISIRAQATDTHDDGESKIAGVLCDNLALRSENQDIQLWIAKGSNPAPCRIVVTYKKVEGQPQF